ncbi:MAG TPA: NUDIX domain-containing protein [Candidatus Saccharimonadales bacterium]|nr:NUDIX domain-containing protein [Candidatus Saccharimonadales bacterium]
MRGTLHIPCAYTLFRRDGKLLFVLREHTGFMDGKYSLPAGHVEPGESFSQAAMREAMEEVGLAVRPEDLRQVYTQHRYQSDEDIRMDVFFEAASWTGEPRNMEPERHGDIAWLDAANLPETLMSFQLHALREILAGKTYGELGWIEEKGQKL